ncbi:hypothetical protein F4820DRAFT_418288 [Hypoxylon rubiginosum]|uniref:Uncharacterized protein n=1 Tax=Hypoxylon rubiginosum TaxID=110542 RepID=A0ACB9Z4Q9_9PEZI|nr:hypothetical protein F4820DRAFT_418288 [Hypoxylon rubiginosum]
MAGGWTFVNIALTLLSSLDYGPQQFMPGQLYSRAISSLASSMGEYHQLRTPNRRGCSRPQTPMSPNQILERAPNGSHDFHNSIPMTLNITMTLTTKS